MPALPNEDGRAPLIRRLAAPDVPALAAAFAPPPFGKPRAQYDRYLAEHLAGERVTLVAWVGDAVAGYVNVLWASGYAPFAEAGIPEINDLNVLPPYRRRGIGTALIRAAEAVVRAARRPVVGIGVGLTADYDAARRLYPTLGYVPDGTGPHADAYDGAEYLTRALDRGAAAE